MLKQIKTILKTAVLIAKTSPWNLPAFIGSRFLEIVQPFVTLFFSAKILDLLHAGRGSAAGRTVDYSGHRSYGTDSSDGSFLCQSK